jgi:uncharacterized protein YjdB
MAKSGLTKMSDFEAVRAREIDFVTRFAKNWDALREVMGILRPIKKTPGTVLTSYTAGITLQSGFVGEGEEIPYSEATVSPVSYADLTLEKYAKAVSIEAVNKYGAAVAIQRTDEAFLNELQSVVMGRFYDFLPTGTLTDNESSFQMAISMAIGKVKDKFKKMHRDATRIVVWVNTLDAYLYLGSAAITIQNQFGVDYIKNFLGADTLILSSEMPQGFVYATPVDNIVNYYIDPADADFRALGLDYTVQGDTNLIGFHANGNYSTAVGESYALMGMTLWAEYIDAIAAVSINGQAKVSLDKSTVAMLTTDDPVTVTAKTIPVDATVTWASSDTSVATVSAGKITAVGAGTATITASVGSGATGDSATCIVTVSAPA